MISNFLYCGEIKKTVCINASLQLVYLRLALVEIMFIHCRSRMLGCKKNYFCTSVFTVNSTMIVLGCNKI